MITEEAVRNWDIKKMSFPEDIKSRGLDSSTLPKFPYRDDAQMIWDVLGEYVAAYLQHFYPTDDLLQQKCRRSQLRLQTMACGKDSRLQSKLYQSLRSLSPATS